MSEENQNEEKVSENIELSFFQKINPVNKDIWIQIAFFLIGTIGSLFFLYYILYMDSKDALVRQNILPQDLEWMLYVGTILLGIDIAILFAPTGEKYHRKIQFKKNFDSFLITIGESLRDRDYDIAKEIGDETLKKMRELHVKEKKAQLLLILRKVNANRKFYSKLQKAKDLKQDGNIQGANRALWDIMPLINRYNQLISKELIDEYNHLIQEMQQLSAR